MRCRPLCSRRKAAVVRRPEAPSGDQVTTTPRGGFNTYLESVRPHVEAALDQLLPAADKDPCRLHEAMRYSVFAGGKRVRPGLLLLAGSMFGAPLSRLLPGAAALEMIHTFSLVHDDLPALDNDDLRRGRPTLHKEYDEALAVLAGDALLNLGCSVVARLPTDLAAGDRIKAVSVLTEAVGTSGMIGGQVADIEAERGASLVCDSRSESLEWVHTRKTGKLIEASLRLGGIYASVPEEIDAQLGSIGHDIGLLFQIADDILDVEGTTEALGKTAGKDVQAEKLTYPSVFGLERSKEMLASVRERALEMAAALPDENGTLIDLIEYLATRDH